MSDSPIPTPQGNGDLHTKQTDEANTPIEPDDLDVASPEATQKLEQVLKHLPPQQRSMVRESIQEFLGIIVSSGGQKMDPEIARMIIESVKGDNENKYQFALKREENRAKQQERKDGLEAARFQAQKRLLWPIILAAIVIVVGCVGSGLYFITIGKDAIGGGILSGIVSAVFGYMGGLGTANFFNKK